MPGENLEKHNICLNTNRIAYTRMYGILFNLFSNQCTSIKLIFRIPIPFNTSLKLKQITF